ncbi:MAG: chemotaxis protein CheW [Hyphomicrobiales bacterium]|nr:chemotaxis protein CheW [Hyphomicrobiales bacterium]
MDELLTEFLTESQEYLETVDRQMVEFESNPSNVDFLRNVFRVLHTIKGTCGFLGLHRLEAIAHAGETLLGHLRDGAPATPATVTLILQVIDRIKMILQTLASAGREPDGDDGDLISALDGARTMADPSGSASSGEAREAATDRGPAPAAKSGEASLDELERVFRDTEGPDLAARPAPKPAPAPLPAPVADEAGEARPGNQTIRVQVGTLEHLMTMVSELVLTRNQLIEIARREDDQHFKLPLQRLSLITAELQDGVMKTRMQPIGNAWNKLPRLVRDLSAELGKKIELVMDGADTELDRQVLELIKDPLMHMVRNSADHGIESPADRMAKGKPETGRIRLSAGHAGGSITIRIADDGRGLNVTQIRAKALEAGLASAADLDRMTDAQAARFILHAGFSTAASVSNVSGRGVGMDVVKSNVEAIGGAIDITSEPGRGTTFSVKIPLTLAIVSVLIVTVADQRYAIPQAAVRELVRVRPGSAHAVETVNGASVLRLRERLLPVVTLSSLLQAGESAPGTGLVVVIQFGQQQFGLLVDAVLQTEEIVVKPLNSGLKSIPLFSGNTILGDGAVVLILDANGLARLVGNGEADEVSSEGAASACLEEDDASQTILVFQGGGAVKAVPLSLVTRLEEIDAARIEQASGRPLVQYRGRLMPIICASEAMRLPDNGLQPLVIFSDGHRTMGMAVEAILDIVTQTVDIDFSDHEKGVLGSAVISGRATEVIDLAHYLTLAYPDWLAAPKATAEATPSRVLLLEQSDFLRDMLLPVIRAAGHVPVPCANLKEGLALLEARAGLSMIVADVENEASGGLDLVRALAGHPRHGQVPIVGLVSIPHPELAARAHAAGLGELVAKFDRPALLAALRRTPHGMMEAA